MQSLGPLPTPGRALPTAAPVPALASAASSRQTKKGRESLALGFGLVLVQEMLPMHGNPGGWRLPLTPLPPGCPGFGQENVPVLGRNPRGGCRERDGAGHGPSAGRTPGDGCMAGAVGTGELGSSRRSSRECRGLIPLRSEMRCRAWRAGPDGSGSTELPCVSSGWTTASPCADSLGRWVRCHQPGCRAHGTEPDRDISHP